ncbi:DUF262 domain-containing protein [Parabacteroides sp. OttesenSCG-928-B22]|nr:DUF262 domain-containing protein [Parabacteroides sp. OttesenSCG-928-B22]
MGSHYCEINQWLLECVKSYVSDNWSQKTVASFFSSGMWQYNRYIQVSTPLLNNDIHYEYCIYKDWNGYVELHIEGRYEDWRYTRVLNYIREKTLDIPTLSWLLGEQMAKGVCRVDVEIKTWEDILSSFKKLIEVFDPILMECENELNKTFADITSLPYNDTAFSFISIGEAEEKVSLLTKKMHEVFAANLVIPDYQRIYCWEDKQVFDLWTNLTEMPSDVDYHLGTIILQKKENEGTVEYNIIDGQQRLVTLTLILRELGYEKQMPLLKQKFLSEDARKHIANNKALIKELVNSNFDYGRLLDKISKQIIFSVLVLNDGNLDLAYTFFSNQNSKGVPLSDYDLLKAHHLRYIAIEEQAEHLAKQWNLLCSEEFSEGDTFIEHTLGVHLYRLRKWMRKQEFDENKERRVKEEFSAAPTMLDVPPFGEQFRFCEKIEGGTYFFSYTEHFVYLYKKFSQTKQVELLRNHLMWESHWKYESIIETLLFGYYIKFGEKYLSEALFCISGIMAQHRYTSTRALQYKITEYARNSEIIIMIDQASSPTFFLAEALPCIRISGLMQSGDIKFRFYRCLRNVFVNLTDFTVKIIKERKCNEYEYKYK